MPLQVPSGIEANQILLVWVCVSVCAWAIDGRAVKKRPFLFPELVPVGLDDCFTHVAPLIQTPNAVDVIMACCMLAVADKKDQKQHLPHQAGVYNSCHFNNTRSYWAYLMKQAKQSIGQIGYFEPKKQIQSGISYYS